MIIAIDFDNTIVKSEFPVIIGMMHNARAVINALRQEGHTIIITTCRIGKHLDAAVDYLKAHGIEYDYINENAPERVKKYRGDCRKISCDVLIDDRAYPQCEIVWNDIYAWIQQRKGDFDD